MSATHLLILLSSSSTYIINQYIKLFIMSNKQMNEWRWNPISPFIVNTRSCRYETALHAFQEVAVAAVASRRGAKRGVW